MQNLLLGFRQFSRDGGRNPAPADIQSLSEISYPVADKALIFGARLIMKDSDEENSDEEDNDEELRPKSTIQRGHDYGMVHGQKCSSPNLQVGGSCTRPVSMDVMGRVNLEHDPYCLRKHFTTRWAVLKDGDGAEVEWSDAEWFYADDVGANNTPVGLQVADDRFSGSVRALQAHATDLDLICEFNFAAVKGRMRLYNLISAQLLLYRVVANFAAPPCTEVNGYKSAWSYTFYHREDPTCMLEISERAGAPSAKFLGSRKSSHEALQLMDWLTGTNYPHSYDYTLCGQVA
ncbi:hypothetical protein PFICI_02484 [Pestalotiopsis fici W106-1]|uniref:Uncharacterized protein n=1 Tax=Pestalotiopsis fici (strain W106-1 / CGMCC3.15140) TaxID=1229662 RepID=W3XEL7_PESFW|nr:uncharacterized protein PFICI_02484 [Pestalotiopsis fici W106-1]ETS84459.1 hypothetical protein PFICI_02484 [Pestalotiopsis fici W106-1]